MENISCSMFHWVPWLSFEITIQFYFLRARRKATGILHLTMIWVKRWWHLDERHVIRHTSIQFGFSQSLSWIIMLRLLLLLLLSCGFSFSRLLLFPFQDHKIYRLHFFIFIIFSLFFFSACGIQSHWKKENGISQRWIRSNPLSYLPRRVHIKKERQQQKK